MSETLHSFKRPLVVTTGSPWYGMELIQTCEIDINADSETPQWPPDVSVFTSLSVLTFPAVQGHSAERKTQPPNWKQLPCYTTTMGPPLVYLLLPAHVHIFHLFCFYSLA